MKFEWEIVEEETKPYWLEIKGDDGSKSWSARESEKNANPIYPYGASVKFDGCIHFWTWANGKGYGHECEDKCDCCENYLHICDIDQMIEILQTLKKKAKEHFGEKWPE